MIHWVNLKLIRLSERSQTQKEHIVNNSTYLNPAKGNTAHRKEISGSDLTSGHWMGKEGQLHLLLLH